MTAKKGYFDYNATTPLCDVARRAWVEASEEAWFNPGALYQGAIRTRILLEDARAEVASILGCAPECVVFTSGATESNNALFQYIKNKRCHDGRVLLSKTEHSSVRHAVECLLPEQYTWLPLDDGGVVRLDALEECLAQGGCQLVSIMAVNNESGVIQPWREIQTLCAQYKVSMHSDATQWIGKMPAGGIGACDFVTLSAHKFGGPKGIGLLKIPSGIDFSSLLGGGQEFGHRSGTENYPSIVGMLSALRVAESYAATAIPGRFECRDALEAALKACIPGVQILCETAPRVWNTTMLLMPRHEGWRWVEKLDSRGYSVGLGAACATRKGVEGSVAVALGASLDAAKRGVRISAGWESPREAWVGLAQALRAVWRELEAEYSGDSIVDIGML